MEDEKKMISELFKEENLFKINELLGGDVNFNNFQKIFGEQYKNEIGKYFLIIFSSFPFK